jgi:hypothetical protein
MKKEIYVIMLILIFSISLLNVNISRADQSQVLTIPITFYGPYYDINHDGVVDLLDVTLLTGEYGNHSGIPGWIREDVVRTGKVDVEDVSMIVTYFGESWLVIP